MHVPSRGDISKLSPAANRLVEMLGAPCERGGKTIDLSGALEQNPELMAGVNEYLAWLAEKERAADRCDQAPAFRHGLNVTAEALRQRSRAK